MIILDFVNIKFFLENLDLIKKVLVRIIILEQRAVFENSLMDISKNIITYMV